MPKAGPKLTTLSKGGMTNASSVGNHRSICQILESHYRFRHNIWDYMYYIGFLKAMGEDSITDYRDVYVFNCLKEQKNSWFPAYKGVVKKEERKRKHTDILGDVIRNDLHTWAQDQEDSSDIESEDEGTRHDNLKGEVRYLKEKINKIESGMNEMNSRMNEMSSEIRESKEETKSMLDQILSRIPPQNN